MMNRPLQYQKGGLKQEGGEIDEVSGNEVPLGGTKEGVRDDIDANLSAGEWVADEATTRYHGLKTFLSMRDEAMMGMKKMEAMGLMGNAEEATLPSDMPFGMADLLVVEVDDSGAEREVNMAVGGMASGQQGETVALMGGQQPVPVRERQDVTFDDVMADAKLEFKEYRNSEGQSLMVPFMGGVPMYPIPEGYTLYTGEGDETEVPDVPDTGAEALVQQDEGRDEQALTAYRQSGKSTKVNWEDMSTEEFLQKANERNGFGRNLALGVASMINPLASIGMSALMRMEDEKVLTMARSRMKALPAGSAQRAEYEKMIAEYEDRGKGIFGGVIGKIADKIGDLLGLSEADKERGKNANMVSHSRNIDTFSTANGQPTDAAVQAVETGNIPIFGAGGVTANQVQEAINTIANPQGKTPEQIQNAKNVAANAIGAELGSWVDPAIMNAVQQGIGDRTPEQTRQDLVNIAYQPASDLEGQIKALSPTQQAFLGYDAEKNNYLDVIDTAREQVSQITPIGATVQAPTQNITRDFTTTATQTQEQARQDQVNALIDIGISPVVANATVPMVNVPQVQATETRNRDSLEGPEAALAATPTVSTTAASEDVNIAKPAAPSYATMDMGEAGRPTVPTTTTTTTPAATATADTNPRIGYESGQDAQQSLPSYITSPLGVDKQTVEAFMPTGTTTTTTTGTGTGRDVADMPVTGQQVAYSTSGGGQSEADKYDPRTVTQVPTEQVTNIPVTTTAQMDISTPTQPAASDTSVPEASVSSIVGDPYVVRRSTGPSPLGVAEDTVPNIQTTGQTDADKIREQLEAAFSKTTSREEQLGSATGMGTEEDAMSATVPEAMGQFGANTGTSLTTGVATDMSSFAPKPAVTLPTSYDSKTVQQQMAELEDNYMAEAFGAETPAAKEETKSKPLTLEDVVPDAKTTTTTTTAQSFDDAFAAARAEEKRLGLAAGTSKFTYNGKEYSTALATDATSTGTSAKKEETKGKYDPTANKQLSAGFTDNKLSQKEQDAFDAAVDSGNSTVANHYASVNRLRNKQDAFAESGFDPAVGASLGLSANDMEQAEKYGGSVQTAINEGRAESQGILKPAKVTDSSKSKTSSSSNKDNDSSPAVSKPSTDKTKNVASSGRTEAEIQAEINKELSGGKWTERANELVKERDSARANEGGGSSDDGGGSSSSNDSGGCFLTTAIVEKRGEADNGTTLTKLRKFRDTYLRNKNNEVEQYYKVAPKIVSTIPKDHTDWDWIGTQVDASVQHIDRGENDLAYKTYKAMVDRLIKTWL